MSHDMPAATGESDTPGAVTRGSEDEEATLQETHPVGSASADKVNMVKVNCLRKTYTLL